MTKTNKQAKLPIFDKKGELLLEKILGNADKYLKTYQPDYSYLHCAIKALIQFEAIYRQYKLEKVSGKLFDAFKARKFYENTGSVSIDADFPDDRVSIVLFLTLKSLALSISAYMEGIDEPDAERIAWSRLNQQTFVIGMLRGAEHLDDDLKNQLKKIRKFDRKTNAERDVYIIKLKLDNPSKLNKNLYDLADKNIIGDITLKTFSNIK
jgi:hypothetical protein